jgi:hypothetical protein
VYAAQSLPTSRRDAEEALRIGVHFDPLSHVECLSAECLASAAAADLRIHLPLSAEGLLDERAVFVMKFNGTERAFANLASTVTVPNSGGARFRNPPVFLSATTSPDTHVGGERPVEHEIEALLEHIVVQHPNTAPMVALHLARSLVTSNPSPRYVHTIVRAFCEGEYGGRIFLGRPGDLGAAVAATLLDREASTVELEADPDYGVLREPILNVVHLLRALEARPAAGEMLELTIGARLQQIPLAPPSVFSFFSPDFAPAGRTASAGLVLPAAHIHSSSALIAFANVVFELLHHLGVRRQACAEADGGTALTSDFAVNSSCAARRVTLEYAPRPDQHGLGEREAVVREMDTLLTGRRADPETLAAAARAFDGAGLRGVQAAFVASPAFHTLGAAPRPSGRWPDARPQAAAFSNSAFRGLVVLYLFGGSDSFSILVPLGGCTGRNLFISYTKARGTLALSRAQLLGIADANGAQACSEFGGSDELAELREYYRNEDVQATESRLSMALPVKWFENAWCSTVHKAQGRGVDHVLFVRKAKPYYTAGCLLYTAHGRAKKSLTLIGPYAFFTSSLAVALDMRLTMLGSFLGHNAEPIQHTRTVEERAARQRRQSIPKPLKTKVWVTHMGGGRGIARSAINQSRAMTFTAGTWRHGAKAGTPARLTRAPSAVHAT